MPVEGRKKIGDITMSIEMRSNFMMITRLMKKKEINISTLMMIRESRRKRGMNLKCILIGLRKAIMNFIMRKANRIEVIQIGGTKTRDFLIEGTRKKDFPIEATRKTTKKTVNQKKYLNR